MRERILQLQQQQQQQWQQQGTRWGHWHEKRYTNSTGTAVENKFRLKMQPKRRKGVAVSSFFSFKISNKKCFLANFKFQIYNMYFCLCCSCVLCQIQFIIFWEAKKVFTAVPYNKLTLETSNGDVDGGHRWGGRPYPPLFAPQLSLSLFLFWWRSSSQFEGTRILLGATSTLLLLLLLLLLILLPPPKQKGWNLKLNKFLS